MKYIGMDVHKEAISIAVLNSTGKLVMECTIETKAITILDFLKGLRGSLHVTFEEGTWAAWLYDLMKPHVAELMVCNPRRNALLKEGSKSDRIDARKLADLLRSNMVRSVYHGEHGVRALKELARSYLTISKDLMRVMTRVKAIYRSWGIPCRESRSMHPAIVSNGWEDPRSGSAPQGGVLLPAARWIEGLASGSAARAVSGSSEARAWKLLGQIPFIGPIRAALLIALIQTPHRFRTKRQLWTYSGLGSRHTAVPSRVVHGELKRAKKPASIRGLNRNHNHDLKKYSRVPPPWLRPRPVRSKSFTLRWWPRESGRRWRV